MLTHINASKEQVLKIYEKHVRPALYKRTLFGRLIAAEPQTSLSYDSEDDIGFANLYIGDEHLITFQIRDKKPCFIEFGKRGDGHGRHRDIVYCLNNLEKVHPEFHTTLDAYAKKIWQDFWKGGEI